jgi:hypothetical protein
MIDLDSPLLAGEGLGVRADCTPTSQALLPTLLHLQTRGCRQKSSAAANFAGKQATCSINNPIAPVIYLGSGENHLL